RAGGSRQGQRSRRGISRPAQSPVAKRLEERAAEGWWKPASTSKGILDGWGAEPPVRCYFLAVIHSRAEPSREQTRSPRGLTKPLHGFAVYYSREARPL